MSPEDASVHASVLCRSVVVVCCDCEPLLGIAAMRLFCWIEPAKNLARIEVSKVSKIANKKSAKCFLAMICRLNF